MRNNRSSFKFILVLIVFSLAVQVLGSSKPKYPIEQAAQEGDVKLLKDLLVRGQSQYQRDSALRFAIRAGHIEIAELLISHGARFALLKAAEEGNIKLVKHFLGQGHKKNTCDSALHGAVRNGHKQIVELLLSHGADVNSLRWGDFTPLFYAVTIGGDIDVLNQFTNSLLSPTSKESRESRVKKQSPATQKEYLDIVKLLINHGADVNIKTNQLEFVPLHYAIFGGNVEIVETLLNKGAEVNPETQTAKISSRYVTPLHLAVHYNDLAICEHLLQRGAKVDSQMPTESSWMYAARQTPLHFAAYSRNTKLVALMIKHGAEINATDHYGRTPLHCAVQRKDRAITKLLLSHGADINATDHYGNKPLHDAAENQDLIIVRMLLSHGADSNPTNLEGRTPTSIAEHNGNTEIVKLLTAKHSQTTIYSAANMGDIDTMDQLIKTGLNVNKKDIHGNTAMHAAITAGQIPSVKWLLDHGAEPNCPENKYMAPLSVSLRIAQTFSFSSDPNEVARFNTIKSKQREIMTLLIRHGASPGFAYGIPRKTVLSHPIKVAELLIDAGPNFEPCDSKATLLHRAAWWGHKEVVEDLIELGADVNAVDGVGGTPLHAAIQSGCTRYWDVIHGPYVDVLEVLVQHGAQVNATNNRNITPLHGAAGYGDVNAVELLIDYGANVNVTSGTNQTPLHMAAIRGSTDVMALLMARGADPNIRDNEGNTLLFLLLSSFQLTRDQVQKGVIDYAIELVRQGVLVDIRNDQGVTPLQQAAALGHPDLLKVILARGAPVNLKSTTGWTALHSAVASGNSECVEMLLKYNAQGNILGTLPDIIRLPRRIWPAQTPLHIAIYQRYNTVIPLLIASGSDVNAVDGNQNTPLQIAIKINNLEAVKLLRESGADSNI